MSYKSGNLSVLAYANGFTLWHYITGDDTAADVEVPEYFNKAADMLRAGDMIFANVAGAAGILTVKSNAGGVVTITPLVPIKR